MIGQDPLNIKTVAESQAATIDLDIDAVIGEILGRSVTDLLKIVRANLGYWQQLVESIEAYLSREMRDLVAEIVVDIDEVSPYERYQILLDIAAQKADSEKEQVVKHYAKLKDKVEWSALQPRAILIAKGMHRSAIIDTMQWGDRLQEEYKIIRNKFNLNDSKVLDAHRSASLLVYDALHILVRTIEHARVVSGGFEDTEEALKWLPEEQETEAIIEGAIVLFKNQGILIPVVIKTLGEQRNPYQLIVFARDLMLLYSMMQKKASANLTELQLREEVAKAARRDDLAERSIIWMTTYLRLKVRDEELNTPFARKIAQALRSNVLGSGKVLTAIKGRLSSLSVESKLRVKYIVSYLIINTTAQIAGLPINRWVQELRMTAAYSGKADVNQAIANLKESEQLKRSSGQSQFNKIEELAELIDLIDSL